MQRCGLSDHDAGGPTARAANDRGFFGSVGTVRGRGHPEIRADSAPFSPAFGICGRRRADLAIPWRQRDPQGQIPRSRVTCATRSTAKTKALVRRSTGSRGSPGRPFFPRCASRPSSDPLISRCLSIWARTRFPHHTRTSAEKSARGTDLSQRFRLWYGPNLERKHGEGH